MNSKVRVVVGAIVIGALVGGFAGFAYGSEENPCGNHGNNCCTNDGGGTFVGVDQECEAFCNSTAVAVSVAVSECEAKATASCKQTCGEQVAVAVAGAEASASAACAQSCGEQVATCQQEAAASCAQTCGVQTANAVADAVANCAQTCVNSCSEPICINGRTKHKRIGGVDYFVRICREVRG